MTVDVAGPSQPSPYRRVYPLGLCALGGCHSAPVSSWNALMAWVIVGKNRSGSIVGVSS